MKIMVAIHDTKAEIYETPAPIKNRAIAIRSFSEMCKDKNSNLAKFPQDYNLEIIGAFDEEEGKLIGTKPEVIAKATDYAEIDA